MFSSDPPSQYCIDKNHARKSWDFPGIRRRILGKRRNIFIWPAPELPPFFAGFSFFNRAIAPVAGRDMSRSPILVNCTISWSAMIPTIASQVSRRAFRSGRIAKIWSSRKITEETIMCAVAISALAKASAEGSFSHSAAACTIMDRPGKLRSSDGVTRATGPAACRSSVNNTML